VLLYKKKMLLLFLAEKLLASHRIILSEYTWGKKCVIFPIVKVRGELPNSFLEFNIENAESKTKHWEQQNPQ